MFISSDLQIFQWLIKAKPSAYAAIKGSEDYPQINGMIKFYQTNMGVYVVTSVVGLPDDNSICGSRIFAIHIHNGTGCSGDETDPFKDAGTHFNPNDCPHPYHAGDMPPLFSANHIAWNAFLTDNFTVDDVTDLPIIIHSGVDDFTTQPSGNSGSKIACGIIVKA